MPVSRRVAGLGLMGALCLNGSRTYAASGDSSFGVAARRVRVLSTTDRPAAQPLIDAFERLHPGLRLDYVQLGSKALVEQFLADETRTADVLWSSAMDLQIKLVNDGHAARYASPHARYLPRWAVWKHEAYSTTSEPLGLVFHRGLLAAHEVPRTHAALAALLRAQAPRFRGRVATYDIAQAGLGFLGAAHDAMATAHYWELVRSLGLCRASLHADTQSMLEAVGAGQALMAYNVLGSYAQAFVRHHPDVGVAYLDDYTLVVSRVAFIARHAPNAEGARAWLDHLLSAAGQRLLADTGGLYGVRIDASEPSSALALSRELGAAARPIALGPGLLAHLDRSKHQALLKRWRHEFDHAQ